MHRNAPFRDKNRPLPVGEGDTPPQTLPPRRLDLAPVHQTWIRPWISFNFAAPPVFLSGRYLDQIQID